MRSFLIALLIFCGCSGGPLAAGAASEAAMPRVALVIGNSDYENLADLANARNDARAVAAALSRLGFDVVLGTDLDQARMNQLFGAFVQQVRGAGVALFYYAGHSASIDARNYLVPVDAQLGAGAESESQGLEAETLFRYLSGATRKGVAFIDATPHNAAPTGSPGLHDVSLIIPELFVGFSTTPGMTTADSDVSNGAFAEALVERLADPGLDLGQLMTRIRTGVELATAGRQLPWYTSTLVSEIVLNPGGEDLERVEFDGEEGDGSAVGAGPDDGDLAGDEGGGGSGGNFFDDLAEDFGGLFGGLGESSAGGDLEVGGFGGEPAAEPLPPPPTGAEPVLIAELPAIDILSPAGSEGTRYVADSERIEVAGRITGNAASIRLVVVDGDPVELAPDWTFRKTVELSGRSRINVLAYGEVGLLSRPLEFDRDDAVASQLQQGDRYALVIASQEYDDPTYPDLRFPAADADAVAGLLSGRFGFKTSFSSNGQEQSLVLHDPSLRDIERAMVRLRDVLEPEDSLLIYYAGHGLWQEEIGLAAWLPRDAEPGFMSSLFTSDLLHLHLAAMKARKILVVSDSCYAGRMTRGGILVPADAESASLAAQRKTRVFLAAGNTEPVPDGGSADGQNSVFASSFLAGLEGMREDQFSAQKLFTEFIEPVVSSPDQEPVWSPLEASGHEGGDFIFMRVLAEDAAPAGVS